MVRNVTVNRFFSLHFFIPFVVLALVVLHVIFLHKTGSNNPLGLSSGNKKVIFRVYSLKKDIILGSFLMTLFYVLCFYEPLILGDNENFCLADPSVTPHHIQPEWYFLFAYAILRSVPNKLGGVISLVISVLILYLLPYTNQGYIKSCTFKPLKKIIN